MQISRNIIVECNLYTIKNPQKLYTCFRYFLLLIHVFYISYFYICLFEAKREGISKRLFLEIIDSQSKQWQSLIRKDSFSFSGVDFPSSFKDAKSKPMDSLYEIDWLQLCLNMKKIIIDLRKQRLLFAIPVSEIVEQATIIRLEKQGIVLEPTIQEKTKTFPKGKVM